MSSSTEMEEEEEEVVEGSDFSLVTVEA